MAVSRVHRLTAALVIGACTGLPSFAGAPLECLMSAFQQELKSSELQYDTAVEAEMDLSPEVMSILTTSDGTVGPLLRDLPVPDWLAGHASARELSWDSLSFDKKARLLKYQSEMRRHDFSASRLIPGIRVRPEVRMTARTPGFLGYSFDTKRMIDTSSFIMTYVEYANPASVRTLSRVELHFRARVPAATLSQAVRLFQQSIGAQTTGQHVHIVSELPAELLKGNPTLESATMSDFVRRLNMLLDMKAALRKRGIYRVSDANGIYSDNLSAETLQNAANFFYRVGQGENPKLGRSLKIANAGMRGPDSYDSPGLWGLEVRAISSGDLPSEVGGMLNQVQWNMSHRSYGISHERIKAWLQTVLPDGGNPARAIRNAWYGRPERELLSAAPADLREAIEAAHLTDFLQSTDEVNKEFKFLLHDWSNDPLFYDDQAMLNRLRAAQIDAILRIGAVEPGKRVGTLRETVADFLISTGLAERVAKSLS